MSNGESGLNMDIGNNEGWLYKDTGSVCGPVSASVLIDKLFGGQLDGETEISREFGDWERLCEVKEFERPWKRAQEAIAEERARRQQRAAEVRMSLAKVGLVLGCALTFGGLGFGGGRFAAIERPWEDNTDWTKKPPALHKLSVKPKPKPIQKKPAEAVASKSTASSKSSAAAQKSDSSAKAKATGKSSKSLKKSTAKSKASKKSAAKKEAVAKKEDKKTAEPAKAASKAKETKVASSSKGMEYNAAGLPRSLTNKQIMKVLASQRRGIAGCLSSEAKRNPDMPPTVTIEFAITRKGVASGFRVVERQVREGTLADCLRTRVMTLRWPQFYGENKTVKIPFNIKRK